MASETCSAPGVPSSVRLVCFFNQKFFFWFQAFARVTTRASPPPPLLIHYMLQYQRGEGRCKLNLFSPLLTGNECLRKCSLVVQTYEIRCEHSGGVEICKSQSKTAIARRRLFFHLARELFLLLLEHIFHSPPAPGRPPAQAHTSSSLQPRKHGKQMVYLTSGAMQQ